MHTNGNQYIITLNRGKGLKKKREKKTIHSFFFRGALVLTCIIVSVFFPWESRLRNISSLTLGVSTLISPFLLTELIPFKKFSQFAICPKKKGKKLYSLSYLKVHD